ncbi:MAG: UbiA family prenyltransferase [Planctomycetes bacterium]|nr:UbiA family prenyltransferase [Planctomycetota bacterium]
MNEIPDYYQDKLVGKRNICVRLGRKNVVKLYGVLALVFYILLVGSLLTGNLPPWAWFTLSGTPLMLVSYLQARRTYDNPRQFVGTIRYLLIHYVLVLGILITAYFMG